MITIQQDTSNHEISGKSNLISISIKFAVEPIFLYLCEK